MVGAKLELLAVDGHSQRAAPQGLAFIAEENGAVGRIFWLQTGLDECQGRRRCGRLQPGWSTHSQRRLPPLLVAVVRPDLLRPGDRAFVGGDEFDYVVAAAVLLQLGHHLLLAHRRNCAAVRKLVGDSQRLHYVRRVAAIDHRHLQHGIAVYLERYLRIHDGDARFGQGLVFQPVGVELNDLRLSGQGQQHKRPDEAAGLHIYYDTV